MYQYSLLIMYFVCIYIASSLGLIPLLHAENRLEQDYAWSLHML